MTNVMAQALSWKWSQSQSNFRLMVERSTSTGVRIRISFGLWLCGSSKTACRVLFGELIFLCTDLSWVAIQQSQEWAAAKWLDNRKMPTDQYKAVFWDSLVLYSASFFAIVSHLAQTQSKKKVCFLYYQMCIVEISKFGDHASRSEILEQFSFKLFDGVSNYNKLISSRKWIR